MTNSSTKASSLPFYLVDAFTPVLYRGNPAGVCILSNFLSISDWSKVDGEWLQLLAREINQAETAFAIYQNSDNTLNSSHYLLKWFTPAVEVDLCGHATLATSKILYSTGEVPLTHQIIFQTQSGQLTAKLSDPTTANSSIELDFPVDLPTQIKSNEDYNSRVSRLNSALTPSETNSDSGSDGVCLEVWRGKFDYLVRVKNWKTVLTIQPDFALLAKEKARGIIITAETSKEFTPLKNDNTQSNSTSNLLPVIGSSSSSSSSSVSFDFVSRFFAPAVGIPEDSVSGSVHCFLACYWGEKLKKEKMLAYQASARGGVIEVERIGDRIKLRGPAVISLSGQLNGLVLNSGS